jgi:hypothetical protein
MYPDCQSRPGLLCDLELHWLSRPVFRKRMRMSALGRLQSVTTSNYWPKAAYRYSNASDPLGPDSSPIYFHRPQ